MSRTREDILADIEYHTELAEYHTELAEDYTERAEINPERAEDYKKCAEYCTNLVELAKQKLKELDEKEKGDEN